MPRRVVVQKKRIEFRKIDLLSAGKVCAAIDAIIGLIAGLIVASLIGGLLVWVPVLAPTTTQMVNIGLVSGASGLAAIVLFPIAGALIGFVKGVIIAFLYNIVAERIGGVQVETK